MYTKSTSFYFRHNIPFQREKEKKTVKKLTLKNNKYSIFISETDDGSQQYEIKMYIYMLVI